MYVEDLILLSGGFNINSDQKNIVCKQTRN